MRKAYLFLAALLAWGAIFWYLYIYQIKGIVNKVASTNVPVASSQIAELPEKILFETNSYHLVSQLSLSELIDTILSKGEASQFLNITGYHHPKEAESLGFDLGWARASEIKKILIDHIPEERIKIFSDTISNFTYFRDSLVEAVIYEWEDGYEPDTQLDYYVLDHQTKRVKTEDFESLLTKIADRLVNTGEKIVIIGHTDNEGDDELNFTIGLRNAKDIRDVLKAKGVNQKQITPTTRGEEAPIADNESEIGKRANRRIELEIK